MIDLTDAEKARILEERLRQFAAEKFNNEVNAAILEQQKAIADNDSVPQIDAEIAQTQSNIIVINKAIETTVELLESVQ